MKLTHWRSNSQLSSLLPHDNIQVVREVFEYLYQGIPRVSAMLPYEFQFNYADYIKTHWPSLWAMGGTFLGNQSFELWKLYRQGETNEKIKKWVDIDRVKYRSFHGVKDISIKGVIGAIKWSITLDLGETLMFKTVVREAIKQKLIKIN